jgi:hypothetical protein
MRMGDSVAVLWTVKRFSFDGFFLAKEGGANGTREFYNPSVPTEDQQHRRIETDRVWLDCTSASLFVYSWNVTRSSFTFLYEISSIANALGRFTKCCCICWGESWRRPDLLEAKIHVGCVRGCSSRLSVLLWFFSVIRSEIVAGAEH